MNASLAVRLGRGVLYASLLLLATIAANTAISKPASAQLPDPGRFCLREWHSDHDAYLLCQQLQTRNHIAFRQFLSDHGLNENDVSAGRAPDSPIARAAKYCLDRYSPDYQSIWGCTQRRTEKDHK